MMKIVVTCEHGGNRIPADFEAYFRNAGEILTTHRGYDIGALELYHEFATGADVGFFSETSRLLVELNRSERHPALFSSYTKNLPEEKKKEILELYYRPYRQQVENQIAAFILAGETVLHLSVHSFTPELDGKVRETDIGLLYDPEREQEAEFCAVWKKRIKECNIELRVRYNYPYKGTADGFTTYLRKQFPERYLGIELEVNQKFPQNSIGTWIVVRDCLVRSFSEATTYFKL